ncbi:unnamed protein product [Haemonchus placei]|uniref:Uncharacterized protein n=1 Tax=Haemonchus placei TaxID=6290 RepID=A0A0N4W1T0_HAEPC|nr:unnamed protein product [Haemonchus placei]
MASTVRTVEGASGLPIENNVNSVEKCMEVSCVLSTVVLLAATDGVVDSDVDFELGRLVCDDGSGPKCFAVFAFYAVTSRLAPYRTKAKASTPLKVVRI